jgi:hypothetical protein
MIKALRKLGIEGMYLNIVKAICDKPTANVILNGVKLKPFPLKSGTRRVPTIPTPIQHSTGIPTREIREEEKIKGIQIGKENVKTSLFADDVILYLKDPK